MCNCRTFTHNMLAFGLSKKLCNDFLKKQAVIGNLNEGKACEVSLNMLNSRVSAQIAFIMNYGWGLNLCPSSVWTGFKIQTQCGNSAFFFSTEQYKLLTDHIEKMASEWDDRRTQPLVSSSFPPHSDPLCAFVWCTAKWHTCNEQSHRVVVANPVHSAISAPLWPVSAITLISHVLVWHTSQHDA